MVFKQNYLDAILAITFLIASCQYEMLHVGWGIYPDKYEEKSRDTNIYSRN